MSSFIYVSTAPSDSTLIKKLEADIVEQNTEKAIAAIRRDTCGEPIDDDMFPKAIYGDKHSRKMTRLPHLFNVNGYFCVSERARDILMSAELGRSRMEPVSIWQRNRKTPVPGSFYCINIAEIKDCLAPEACSGLRKNPYTKTDIYNPPYVMTDDAITVKKSAYAGPEIWRDPALRISFFVSGSLGNALIGAGMGQAFRLFACTIVD